MEITLYEVLNALVLICSLIVLYALSKIIQSNAYKVNLDIIEKWGSVFIIFVESTKRTGLIKKEMVVKMLNRLKINISYEELSLLIDALCDKLTQEGKINTHKEVI